MKHAKYSILEEKDGGDVAAPGSITVTYTCDEGYELVDATKDVVGCGYIPRPGDKQKDMNQVARWTSAEGIECSKVGKLHRADTRKL